MCEDMNIPRKEMHRIRVGGVDEHFNEVWQIGIEKKCFETEGIDLEWISIKEGTGAMIEKLKRNEVDVIVALTEGLILDIFNGSSIRLIGTYVQSPLLWSISVHNQSSYQTIDDLKGKIFGISRYRSGSHLMSYVLGMEYGWNFQDLQFSQENNFDHLRESLLNEKIDAFLWEYFMQKPFYDAKVFRSIGRLVSPWSCFLIASRKDFIDENLLHLQKMFSVLNDLAKEFHQNRNSSIERISKLYHLSLEDAQQWFNSVQIIGENVISKSTIETTIETLKNAQLISLNEEEEEEEGENCLHPEDFLDQRICRILLDIKSMRLYNKPELLIALRNQLRVHGLSKGSLSYQDLLSFDQNHYYGTDVLDLCANFIHLKRNSLSNNESEWIIQIGSNLGGCTRYLAGKYHCRILAIELQNDLSEMASELTERCQLNHFIQHLTGNFLHLSEHLQKNFYSSIVSWLTILHFEEKERMHLFHQSYRLLKCRGYFYAEDFIRIDQLTDEEKEILERDVFCRYLPTLDEYKEQLNQSGFRIIFTEDLTSSWKDFTSKRSKNFQENASSYISIHGKDLYSRLAFFYQSIETLFQNNHCGGIRILAQKL